MAWLWKQGRPTLLAVVGAGVLGYKAFHRGRAPVGQGHAAVGVWDAATAHPPRTTRTSAATPAQSGWLGGLSVKELASRVMKEVREDDCLGWAAQLAYYLLFAVFPFFLFVTALLGFLPIPNLMERLLAGLAIVLPGEAVTLLQDNIRQLVTEQKGGLLSFGILAALWSSSSAVVAITAALNQAYDVEEGRPWWKVRGIALLLTMGQSLFLLLAMVLLIFGPQLGRGLASLVGLGSVFEILWNILRWPVSAGLLMVALALVYYFAPDVEQQWKWITPGAVCAVLATLLVSLGFSLYVSHFGSYNKTYGSLGAVIVFLTWLYLTGLCLLVGGEINAEIEHAAPEGKAPGRKTGA
jgi:membrane protein